MRSAPPGSRWVGRVLLALDGVVAALFFLAFWGINAEPLGRHDLGLALPLSFAVPLTVYCSVGLAVLSAALGGVAWARGRPVALYVWGVLLALLPLGFLVLLDARLLPIR